MKVKIENEGCIGCGLCESVCPEVFRMTDNGYAEVFGDVTVDNTDAVMTAIESCPVNVISEE